LDALWKLLPNLAFGTWTTIQALLLAILAGLFIGLPDLAATLFGLADAGGLAFAGALVLGQAVLLGMVGRVASRGLAEAIVMAAVVSGLTLIALVLSNVLRWPAAAFAIIEIVLAAKSWEAFTQAEKAQVARAAQPNSPG
jgi:hypothetical protein